MRFICPELLKANLSEYISELYKTTAIKKEAEQDMSGTNMPKVSDVTQENTKPSYVYGTTGLYYLYESLDYDDTSGRTIADLSSDINGTITNYTDLSTEGFTFQFQNWQDKKKPFKTSFWWTILTDSGPIFAKPERQSTSNQIATYTVVSRNKRSDNFDDVHYQGESGADFYISANVDVVVPDSLDDTLKTMTLNKFKSANDVLIIRSNYNASPLDYVVDNNNTYLVINKKQITQQSVSKPLYEYMCIKEVSDTYTFSGADQEPPVHPLIGTSVGGSTGSATKTRITARRTTAQTINNNTVTTFIWTTEDEDTLSEYNATTGIFSPATAKRVMITSAFMFTSTGATAGSLFRYGIRNNAGTFKKLIDTSGNAQNLSCVFPVLLTVSSSETYNFTIQQITGANITSFADGRWCWLEIEELN